MNNIMKTNVHTIMNLEAVYGKNTLYIEGHVVDGEAADIYIKRLGAGGNRKPFIRWTPAAGWFKYQTGLDYGGQGGDWEVNDYKLQKLAANADFKKWLKANVLPIVLGKKPKDAKRKTKWADNDGQTWR